MFQRHINLTVEGLDGVLCHIDDVLVHGADQAEHDVCIRAVITVQPLKEL